MKQLGFIGIFNVFVASYDRANTNLTVEFYDSRFTRKFGPNGQFVSRYYVSTFLDIKGVGLLLSGDESEWKLTPEQVAAVQEFLRKEGY